MVVEPSLDNLQRAADLLKQGELVAFPTETVYGLGANALNEDAVQKIFNVKARPVSDPLIVHVDSIARVDSVAEIEPESLLAKRFSLLTSFWPGPLSIILPKKNCVPDLVTAGLSSVALRIPSHHVALALLKLCCLPIAAPSANPFSYVSPTTAKHVHDQLGSKVELILDGGPCSVGIESSVVSLVNDKVIILRPGAVTKEMIERVLGETVSIQTCSKETKAMPSPGLLEKHYSPKTKLAFKDQVNLRALPGLVGLIRFSDSGKDSSKEFHAVRTLSKSGDKDEIARNLYSAIREQDNLGLDLIVIDHCDETGIGTALMDRLKRAVSQF